VGWETIDRDTAHPIIARLRLLPGFDENGSHAVQLCERRRRVIQTDRPDGAPVVPADLVVRLAAAVREAQNYRCVLFRPQIQNRYVGVTAAHVVKELLKARRCTPSLACLIQLTHFNILNAIIDANDKLDIATFRISEEQVRSSGVQAFDVSAQWPAEIQINRQMPIQLVGFPEFLREIDYASGSVSCGAYQALALVEDCHDREIINDPEQSWGSPGLLPLGLNMSGCSGGPAVIHHTRNSIHRWYPVGLILGGRHGQGEGDSASYDAIRIRRIDCIAPDGHIQTPDTGWLPP
jgi:hypothetical protein